MNQSSRPVELAESTSRNHKRSPSGDHYYEDIDPRFVETRNHPSLIPAGLAINPPQANMQLGPNHPNEDAHSGSRSPAESERSNFTSVSRRGVNPRWQEAYAEPLPSRRPVPPQQNDILLNSNPDFQIPGARGGLGGRMPGAPPRAGGGMVPGSAYPGGAR